MKPYLLIVLLFLQVQFLNAQTDSTRSRSTEKIKNTGFKVPVLKNTPAKEKEWEEPDYNPFNLGLGAGIDYGGLGAKLSYLPSKQVILFGSLGYNLANITYNAGAGFRLSPDKNLCPYLLAMYGYNAVILVLDASEFNKTYYGPTVGMGLEIGSKNYNHVHIGLLVPFRPVAFNDDMEKLERMGISFSRKPIPISISLGYHFKL